MPANRNTFGALLTPGIRKVVMEVGVDRPPEFSAWANVPDMPWNPVTDRQITGLTTVGSMPEGTQFPLDNPILGGTKAYEAVPYGGAFEVTRPMWEDDFYGPINDMGKELGRSSRQRMEIDAHSLLNNAFSTSFVGFIAAESLCSTSHARIDGGAAQANRPSPDIGFSVTGIQALLVRFENLVNERGLTELLQPSMFLVTPTNKFNAREILGSAHKPFTADNEINSLLEEDMGWMVNHYLTTATYWFGLCSKSVHDLNFFIRTPPSFDSFDDPWTGNAVFTVWQRHIPGFGRWKGIDGSTG
jgi:hypothetical protein